MKTDHTKDVEKRAEAIRIERLDGCSFFASKEGSAFTARFCAYCRFGQFIGDDRNGLCKYKKI